MNEEDYSTAIIQSVDDKSVEDKIRNFDELLQNIDSLSDKKRQLWKEIYENAVVDRKNSLLMFKKLAKITKESSSEHAIHGRTMNAYIERMSKANDQIIRLAELIAKADGSNGDEPIDPHEMWGKIGNVNR